MKKKGSLSLSVNAIVVLILAIVMLGLGLGFIRGMFGKVSTQVEEAVAAEPTPAVPTATNPITLSRESIITNANNKEVMKVSTHNPTNTAWTDSKPSISCTGITIDEGSQSANEKTVAPGEFETYNLLITIPAAGADTYLCQMTMETYEKDMTIKIVE